jgi:hypothetical protein
MTEKTYICRLPDDIIGSITTYTEWFLMRWHLILNTINPAMCVLSHGRAFPFYLVFTWYCLM